MDDDRFEELREKALGGELPTHFGVQEVAEQLGRTAAEIDGEELDAESSAVLADALRVCEKILSTAAVSASGEDDGMNLADASVASLQARSRETLERWIRERGGLPTHAAIDEVLVGEDAVDALNQEGSMYELVELAEDNMVGVTRTVAGRLYPFRTIDVATGLDTGEMLEQIAQEEGDRADE